MKELAPNIFLPETREEFENWIERYPLGFLINYKSPNDIRTHYGKCGHLKRNEGKRIYHDKPYLQDVSATLQTVL